MVLLLKTGWKNKKYIIDAVLVIYFRIPSVLGTTSLYGCRTIKGLRHVVRDGTAWGKVDRIIEVLVLW